MPGPGGGHHRCRYFYLFLAIHAWIRLSGRATPRHESGSMDCAGADPFSGLSPHWFDYLFAGSRTFAVHMPAMFGNGFRTLQFLPELQIQPASRLPKMPARGFRYG